MRNAAVTIAVFERSRINHSPVFLILATVFRIAVREWKAHCSTRASLHVLRRSSKRRSVLPPLNSECSLLHVLEVNTLERFSQLISSVFFELISRVFCKPDYCDSFYNQHYFYQVIPTQTYNYFSKRDFPFYVREQEAEKLGQRQLFFSRRRTERI